MEESRAIEAFAALAQPSRMAIFRLLVRAGPGGLRVTEIGRRLGIPPSTLSGHLAILRRAGLVTAQRQHREILHSADLGAVGDLVGFLLADCCEGRVDCSPMLPVSRTG